jgi:hypothetical protein
MERRYDTAEAKSLFVKVLNRDEYEAWDLALLRLQQDASAQGRREIRIRSPHRTIVATVYAFRRLNAIYVLGYHLERAKEPTWRQVETMNAYVAELERLEGGHG